MPDNKKKPARSGSSSGKKTAAKASKPAAKKPEPKSEKPARRGLDPESKAHIFIPFILVLFALFLLLGMVTDNWMGFVGKGLRWLFYGLFGGAAFAVPMLTVVLAFFWRNEVRNGTLKYLILFQVLFLLFLDGMIHLWTGGTVRFDIAAFWENGTELCGGGVIGGIIGCALHSLVGDVGAHLIGIPAIIIFGLSVFGITPYSAYIHIAYFIKKHREEAAENPRGKHERRVFRIKPEPEPVEKTYPKVRRDPNNKHRFVPDVEVGEGADGTEAQPAAEPDIRPDGTAEAKEPPVSDDDIPPFDIPGVKIETVKAFTSASAQGKSPEKSHGTEKSELETIFGDTSAVDDAVRKFAEEQRAKAAKSGSEVLPDGSEAELEISRTPAAPGENNIPEIVKKEYRFPPVSLLRLDTSPKNVDISDELHTNAKKLVDTLASFRVRTRIVNVSRGPAITRYELAPEEGVRVRAIANLVDDIALNLATTGVRIEAPIPGKAAVGIEVPNKTVSTVYLRELVDTETFRKAQSKLNVSLGVDVAGEPVFLDIAKMPHLLIAGATGMGKSVCINSIITSLLYKAKPEEVKLILVDPKKVELNIYNGLPHLLVPVVSDPKKAAGSLHWAVTEMERRFELIEDVGVRDVKNYNNVTKDDPDREFLPQIVIIIDELADLMMTAPDDVEESICRLAQKARAAGMHLIIGTQRPSVDVITGLIKANVPSRIAFTVASQTDSRVVLDMAGAEKLIGRGDMLYAPVGASKPIRVQGAFVSESEVESIVAFIKDNDGGKAEYSSDIMDSIDRAAAACGSGKRGAQPDDDTDDGGDPMLKQAIELAIESGKISTSLIQRRLSLGYGRAAKLIDAMERRGIVSPPEGQKPRTVLITKQQYMEMVVNRSDELE